MDGKSGGMTFSADQVEREIRRINRKKRRKRVLCGLVCLLLLAVIGALLLSRFTFTLVTVHTPTMRPTLEQGSVLLCRRTSGRDAARGDVILFGYEQQLMLRRVIGLPGDMLTVDDTGAVIRNDEPLTEPYAQYGASVNSEEYPLQVPEGTLFVLADSRGGSLDSRNAEFGLVPASSVRGEPVAVLWPLYLLGRVEAAP